MNKLKLKIKQKSSNLVVEMDAGRFEKLAASFGMFNPDFLKSVKRAESDYKKGRVKKIKSLKELTKK